ncbi:MAG: 4-(cytidine 5'-diphospho)-2-C-methyl-D-erythritol kinase [Verrucomicrobiales bacterium]|nr:4-(cytidine 5'-diphospho)-2-C-methyl-D-erythritol kinase [Verrucomicrobiales bacterium]MCP5526700.1 4-(cytidine 5'-diphospho)-2-C-methyl-D-erythritol kinase [Verrucomicrobiales bacterium]
MFGLMRRVRSSPCKVNLLLNTLGRRPDGFHELETLLLPVAWSDELELEATGDGATLECDHPEVPCDGRNLVLRAAAAFFAATGVQAGARFRLTKRIPMAAGLGGGSSNAAAALRLLNERFGSPLAEAALAGLASSLGSDVPFFLQSEPAIGRGRGERLEAVGGLRALDGLWLMLVHPGFGVSTPWAYQHLAAFPEMVNGRPGRAARMAGLLAGGDRPGGLAEAFNSLEAPVLAKYPVLRLYQDFLREMGALTALMSGSGSTTFALFGSREVAEPARTRFLERFGARCWTALVPAVVAGP